MINLYRPNIDESTVDNLISGTRIPTKHIAHELEGTGVVKRGTPLTTADGEVFTPSATDIRAILMNDVDTSIPEESMEVAVYRNGEYNQNVIEAALQEAGLLAAGTNLDPLEIENARAFQIFIAPQHPAPEPW